MLLHNLMMRMMVVLMITMLVLMMMMVVVLMMMVVMVMVAVMAIVVMVLMVVLVVMMVVAVMIPRQHCRLSICENWLSWTNTETAAATPPTVMQNLLRASAQ